MLVIPVCYVRCMINMNHSVLVAPTGTSGANKFPPVNNALGEPAEFIPDLPSFISSSTGLLHVPVVCLFQVPVVCLFQVPVVSLFQVPVVCLFQVPVVCLFYVFQVVFISKHHMEEYTCPYGEHGHTIPIFRVSPHR